MKRIQFSLLFIPKGNNKQKLGLTIMLYGFVENIANQCIYMKINGSKYIIWFLYVENILLVVNDVGLLYDVKKFLAIDMGEASYVIGIEIFRD